MENVQELPVCRHGGAYAGVCISGLWQQRYQSRTGKLKEMGVDPEQAKELKENAQKAEEAAEKPITSEECVAAAETAEQAGFASKEAAEAAAKELDESTKEIKEEAKKELAKESAVRAKSDRPFQYRYNENASDDEQDKALDEGLDNRSDVDETEEDKEREAAESKSDDVKTNESSEENKNNESGTVSGKEDSGKDSGKEDTGKDSGEESGAVDADAPYAIAKVIGATYSTSTEVQGASIWARYRVESTGDWISISCSTSHAGSFIANVTSYDQQTGVGVAEANGESHTFRISGEPGSMSLTFGE